MKRDFFDPRFKQANREAWIGVGLALVNFIWWYGFAYGLGSKPVSDYEYIFGLPAWFFYSCVAGFVVMVVLVWVTVSRFFKDMPLETREDEEKEI